MSDGDTFTMEADGAKIRVRICGIDAPERGHAGYGHAAGVLSSMIEGKTVHCLQVGEGTVCDGRSRPTSCPLGINSSPISKIIMICLHAWVAMATMLAELAISRGGTLWNALGMFWKWHLGWSGAARVTPLDRS